MNEEKNTQRETWGSKFGFVMAAAGSAVGLGNIWKFPYLSQKHGGAAFLFIYLFFTIIIGMALMLAEFAVGRATRLNPVGAFKKLEPKFTFLGVLMVVSILLMLSYYSVVGGWIVSYIVIAFKNLFCSNTASIDYNMVFNQIISSPEGSILYLFVFLFINAVIVTLGIQKGVEKTSKILMPLLFFILFILVIRAVTLEGSFEGIKFFLKPDFSQINPEVILAAMGQVFLSLSLGIGVLLTYGSYIKKEDNLIKYSYVIPLIDTGFSIIAGLMVMPAVYAFHMQEKSAGPGLIFSVLPEIFKQIPLGSFLMFLFFLLVLCAAITSSLSMLEECVTCIVDEKHIKRSYATIASTIMAFIIGIPSALSFNTLANHKILNKNIFDLMDFSICEVLMPVCGIFLCIFVSWIWYKPKSNNDSSELVNGPIEEITNNGKIKFVYSKNWLLLIRYITPILITIILVSSLLAL